MESDSMGSVRVPAVARYGAQTARAVENFPISSLRFPRSFIKALGLIKKHAATVNSELGLLSAAKAKWIRRAAEEVQDGALDHEFVVDIFQTGSGTSTNMNVNEVIAHRAMEISGRTRSSVRIHPNDDVNLGQSSNDVIPSAIHLAALAELTMELIPAMEVMKKAFRKKALEFNSVLKIGRTHLQDATPIRLGQEFGGYATQTGHTLRDIQAASTGLRELALGGTAVGTGLNTHTSFARIVIKAISKETGLSVREARDHFSAQASIQACAQASASLKVAAASLIKIANDIRWLGSGPRCGLGEIKLPPTQPGSSIMPGKVNPVMCEMLVQVCAQVMGNDGVIVVAATLGAFELNTMLPVTAYNLLQSIELLSKACRVFTARCLEGIEADRARCEAYIEQSLSMCTALAPEIGYDRAAQIAKEAYQTGKTIREIAAKEAGLSRTALNRLLDPERQAGKPWRPVAD
jgi:fumarate hydratase class II